MALVVVPGVPVVGIFSFTPYVKPFDVRTRPVVTVEKRKAR